MVKMDIWPNGVRILQRHNEHLILMHLWNRLSTFILKHFLQNLKNPLVAKRTIYGRTLGRPCVAFGNRATVFQQHCACYQFTIASQNLPLSFNSVMSCMQCGLIPFLSSISDNAPFCNRNVHMCAHFCNKMWEGVGVFLRWWSPSTMWAGPLIFSSNTTAVHREFWIIPSFYIPHIRRIGGCYGFTSKPPAARNGVNAITQKPRDALFSNLVYTLVVIVSWPD